MDKPLSIALYVWEGSKLRHVRYTTVKLTLGSSLNTANMAAMSLAFHSFRKRSQTINNSLA